MSADRVSADRVNVAAGRVAVVTGAARGIGQAIALRLAEAGHAMALGDVRPAGETAQRIRNGGGETLSVSCDLGTSEGVDLLVRAVSDRFGRCDVLVNCAGRIPGREPAGQLRDHVTGRGAARDAGRAGMGWLV